MQRSNEEEARKQGRKEAGKETKLLGRKMSKTFIALYI
jgi:hypothetical protein